MEKGSQFITPMPKGYTKEDVQQVAGTIRKQMAAPQLFKFWSWGATKFLCGVVCNKAKDDEKNIALRFWTNGMKHKGYVLVMLNSLDYYDVEFISRKGNLLKRVEDVDCFQLQEVIDDFVEKISAYAR